MKRPEGAGLELTSTHWLQLTATVLLILAGWLWSSKLAIVTYQAQVATINSSLDDQVALLTDRLATQTDTLRLMATGHRFLDAKSPRFAVVALSQAVKLDPANRDSWYLLAYSYVELANEHYEPFVSRSKATAALKKALAIDANYEPAKELLEQLSR